MKIPSLNHLQYAVLCQVEEHVRTPDELEKLHKANYDPSTFPPNLRVNGWVGICKFNGATHYRLTIKGRAALASSRRFYRYPRT